MDKINFQNGVSGKTPLNATNLNKMQENVEKAIDDTKQTINEKVDGIVLFEDEDGLNDEITLSETIANFNEIKIDYKVVFSTYTARQSIRTPIKSGENVVLNGIFSHSDTLHVHNLSRYLVSGATITKQSETESRIDNTQTVAFNGTTSRIRISKVTAYKS